MIVALLLLLLRHGITTASGWLVNDDYVDDHSVLIVGHEITSFSLFATDDKTQSCFFFFVAYPLSSCNLRSRQSVTESVLPVHSLNAKSC